MGLLDKLAQDKPYMPLGVRYPEILTLVRKHYDEIQEAVKKRYSWTRINQRAQEAWRESGELKYQWKFAPTLLYSYYHRVKKEREVCNEGETLSI